MVNVRMMKKVEGYGVNGRKEKRRKSEPWRRQRGKEEKNMEEETRAPD